MKPKNTICLWFDKDAEDAARFYAATFPDSKVTAVHKAPGDFPGGKQGDVLTVEFTVSASRASASTAARCSSTARRFPSRSPPTAQEETDRYWNAIVGNGGKESDCGWCKDRWGLSWQITPRALTDALGRGRRRSQARLRRHDDHEEDRRSHHRESPPRLKRKLSLPRVRGAIRRRLSWGRHSCLRNTARLSTTVRASRSQPPPGEIECLHECD